MKRVGRIRRRFWGEIVLSIASTTLFVVTLFWNDWIEAVFHVDPDHGNGLFEWFLVIVLAGAAIVCSMLARLEWRRAIAASA